MGRGTKSVQTLTGLDRRATGYYATPSFVADFLAHCLEKINPKGKLVLDPCVGKEELLAGLALAGKEIHSLDVIDFGSHRFSRFTQSDFFEYVRKRHCEVGLHQNYLFDYDFYIANPPYNCHEGDYIRKNKPWLRQLFPGVGTHNMYSMFIAGMIDCAREGAVIAFITLDSFLTARVHFPLRQKILRECTIRYLLLCPTDLFRDQCADVRTCIMVLQKGRQFQRDIWTLNRQATTSEFRTTLEAHSFEHEELQDIVLNDSRDLSEFVIGCPKELRELFSGARLGELFPCVTGISTGEDEKFLTPAAKPGFSTPFYKNPGSARFFCEPNGYLSDGFLRLDEEIPNFIVRNKNLLFKPGITCSSMGVPFSACYLPENSTYGVNANVICPLNEIWWLLSYLNSLLVTYMVRGIMLRTNMITSGYVSRVPVPRLSSHCKNELATLGEGEYKRRGASSKDTVFAIDQILYAELQLPPEARRRIASFCADLLRLT